VASGMVDALARRSRCLITAKQSETRLGCPYRDLEIRALPGRLPRLGLRIEQTQLTRILFLSSEYHCNYSIEAFLTCAPYMDLKHKLAPHGTVLCCSHVPTFSGTHGWMCGRGTLIALHEMAPNARQHHISAFIAAPLASSFSFHLHPAAASHSQSLSATLRLRLRLRQSASPCHRERPASVSSRSLCYLGTG
jgi:hypothetical protein